MTSNERREAEQRRGAEIVARQEAIAAPQRLREERMEVLRRLVDGEKIHLSFDGKNQVAYLTVGNDPDPIAAEVFGPAYPTEQFVARCVLAIEAYGEWGDVPDESKQRGIANDARRRRDQLRNQTSATGWKAAYEPKK